MKVELRKTTIKLHARQYETIEAIANKNGESVSEVVRKLIDRGLEERVVEENTNLIANIVRQQMEIVIRPHIERLAKLSSKSGHMSAASAFLNTQALMDLVPLERKKDVRQMFDNARKKSAQYMKTPTSEWEE